MRRDDQLNWSEADLDWVWENGKARGIQWLRDEAERRSLSKRSEDPACVAVITDRLPSLRRHGSC